MIAIACAGCKCQLRIRDRASGSQVRCPRCGVPSDLPAAPNGVPATAQAAPRQDNLASAAPYQALSRWQGGFSTGTIPVSGLASLGLRLRGQTLPPREAATLVESLARALESARTSRLKK